LLWYIYFGTTYIENITYHILRW